MNPIFNEYLTFLRDTSGKQLSDLKEGYFWLDNQIIKGFDKQGNIHKFYRIKISDLLLNILHLAHRGSSKFIPKIQPTSYAAQLVPDSYPSSKQSS